MSILFFNQKFDTFELKSWKSCQITEWSCWKTLCRSHVICKGFFSMTTLWFDKIFNFSIQMYFDLKKDTRVNIIQNLWICYLRMAIRDGDNFCKAFAKLVPIPKNYNAYLKDFGPIVNVSYYRSYILMLFKFQRSTHFHWKVHI